MLDFVVNNYTLFIIIGIVLLLGLFGYIMDRKKYEKYRREILNEGSISTSLDAAPNIDMVADKIDVNENVGLNTAASGNETSVPQELGGSIPSASETGSESTISPEL